MIKKQLNKSVGKSSLKKSRVVIKKSATPKKRVQADAFLKNPHPGDILKEEFLEPLGLSQNALAQAIGVPSNRISDIIRGRRGITADTDLRLSRFFELSDGYWLRLQNSYDTMEVRRSQMAKKIADIRPYAVQRDDQPFA
jgi:antitoxin HigA-1